MDYSQLVIWLKKLSDEDLSYLKKHHSWKEQFEKLRSTQMIPKGFIEMTMEILEDGSESET